MAKLTERHEDGTVHPIPNRNIEPWIGVDLDGTLAHYDEWRGPHLIGPPIKKMVARVNKWHKQGKIVKIITARVGNQPKRYAAFVTKHIHKWLEENGMPKMEVVATKDFGMVEMYDDRCVQMVTNTGLTLQERLKNREKPKNDDSVSDLAPMLGAFAPERAAPDPNTIIEVGGVKVRAYQFTALSDISTSKKEPMTAVYRTGDQFLKVLTLKNAEEWQAVKNAMLIATEARETFASYLPPL
jgi:hypothetical protein